MNEFLCPTTGLLCEPGRVLDEQGQGEVERVVAAGFDAVEIGTAVKVKGLIL